ncbi:MAG: phosphodiester glycosidase family protein [Bacilli bacterium]|nr:phosphodiester glycosidase family protein [Bacilli bacterium]
MKRKVRKILLFIFLFIIVLTIFLLYGPISYFRDTLITTAMTTKSHQFIATFLYSNKTIEKVMSENKVIETKTEKEERKNSENYDKEILDRKNNELYKLIEIKEKTFSGYLVAIYDPKRVSIATSKYLGKKGEYITTVSKDNNAKVMINASGFYDPDWNSNGAIPHGIVVKNKKIVSEFEKANVGGGLVGFDENDNLIMGNYTKEEVKSLKIRDAVEFGPFLIRNGEKSIIKGNGGWGIAPRTVIGQRKDKIVLFLIIDGRTTKSLGADMNDLIKIMSRYKAYNAANMDGGSSTELVINNKVINTPVAGEKNGLRKLPTFWMVK